jgi:hypothetical protein
MDTIHYYNFHEDMESVSSTTWLWGDHVTWFINRMQWSILIECSGIASCTIFKARIFSYYLFRSQLSCEETWARLFWWETMWRERPHGEGPRHFSYQQTIPRYRREAILDTSAPAKLPEECSWMNDTTGIDEPPSWVILPIEP